MIPFTVFGVLLLLTAGILFLSVSLSVSVMDEVAFTVKISGIRVYSGRSGRQKEKPKEPSREKPAESAPKSRKKPAFFTVLKEKHGFSGAVREAASLAEACIARLKKLKGRIKFRDVFLEITVSSDNAAKTAIEYGTVCSLVYPAAGLFHSVFKPTVRKIDVKSDFTAGHSSVRAGGTVKTRLFWLLLAAYGIFCELRAFEGKNGLLKQEKKGSQT